ncbi:MAG: POTRA domain-containing protein [Candidatus Brocadiia bacterium]
MNRPSLRTWHRQRLFGWVALLATLAGGLAFGQTELPRIARINLSGNQLLSRQRVLATLGLQEGMNYRAEAVEEAIARWNERGVYGALSFRVEPAQEGNVELVLSLSERVAITGIVFQGHDRFSATRLRELAGLSKGDVVSRSDILLAEQGIQRAYREEGYTAATAEGALDIEDGERQLAFYISEGPRTYVEQIACEGNQEVDCGEIRDAMRSRRRHWPAFLWPGWYRKDVFEGDLPRVEDLYRGRGYLDARVSGHATFSDDMRRATLHVVVQEGSLYSVGSVSFEGNTLFRDAELLEATGLQPGRPYRPAEMEEALRTIEQLYGDQGHLDATERKGNLQGVPIFPEVGTEVAVRFRITEGERVYVRRIEVRGLTKTKETVVRRNLNFYPGQIASRSRLEESENLLRNTGYFYAEGQEEVQVALEPDEGQMRDAVVRVQEGPTGRLMLGAGLGSESGVIGQISLTEENFDFWNWPSSWNDLWRGNAFRGGGHRLSIMLQAGTERSQYSVSFQNPAVWNSEYSFGAQVFSRGVVRNEFDETRTGVAASVGQRISKFARRTVTIGYESIDIDDVADDAALEIKEDEDTHSKPYVEFELSTDRRDSRFAPTSGYAAAGTIELAAGDVETVKAILRGEKYWTVRERRGRGRHVLGVRGRMGVVDSYDSRVPVFERFYAGGISTLRGFEYEGVSPVDPATGDQIGGESLLVGSLEYSLPLVEERGLRLVTFMDAGYVQEDAEDVLNGWDELRLSVGVGVRWRLMFFGPAALEVDLATALMEEDEDETQSFHFTLGAERRF